MVNVQFAGTGFMRQKNMSACIIVFKAKSPPYPHAATNAQRNIIELPDQF